MQGFGENIDLIGVGVGVGVEPAVRRAERCQPGLGGSQPGRPASPPRRRE